MEISVQDLLCTVNIQHNCAEQECKAVGHQSVYQECQLTTQTRPIVIHNRADNDLVLNTAQMRDAIHIQRFRISSEILDMDGIVHESAVKGLAALKAIDTVSGTTASSASKCGSAGHARGRVSRTADSSTMGHARPRQISQLISNS
jgi:hypothetical protein